MTTKEAVEHTERAAGGVFNALGAGIGELSDELIRLHRLIEEKDKAICLLLGREFTELTALEVKNNEAARAIARTALEKS